MFYLIFVSHFYKIENFTVLYLRLIKKKNSCIELIVVRVKRFHIYYRKDLTQQK